MSVKKWVPGLWMPGSGGLAPSLRWLAPGDVTCSSVGWHPPYALADGNRVTEAVATDVNGVRVVIDNACDAAGSASRPINSGSVLAKFRFAECLNTLLLVAICIFSGSPSVADESARISSLLSSKSGEVGNEIGITVVNIDGCYLTITKTYESQCDIPVKVKEVKQEIDLRTVGSITPSLLDKTSFIYFEPRTLFGLYLPGASVQSESTAEYCDGGSSSISRDTYVEIFAQTERRGDVARDLWNYVLKHCNRK